MDKKDITLPFIVFGLSIAFFVVTLGVYLTRGKSPYWISKKIAVGALLLSFTSLANNSCGHVDCYAPPPPSNQFELDSGNTSTISVNLKESNTLTGTLLYRSGTDFTFNVTDTLKEKTYQTGKIKAKDGKYDEYTEDILIELDTSLKSNTYFLYLYPTGGQNLSSYVLNITND